MKNLASSTLTASLFRNSAILLVFWAIFFPGFFSSDSFGAVAMAKTGEFTNSGTASWALYVRIFSLFGNAIGLLTLIGGLLLIFSTTQFAYSIFSKRTASLTSFLLSLTPLVWGMGITLWHDILMTSGLLLVTSFMVTVYQRKKPTALDVTSKLILGSVLVSFRPNGLPVLLVFSILLFVSIRKRDIFKFLLLAISVSSLTTFIGSNLILGMAPINDYYAQEWLRNDISCFANTTEGAGFVEKNIPGVGDTETWKSQAACTFLNKASLSSTEIIESQEYVPSAWITLLWQEPFFILDTHLKRHAYLVPLPFNGLPKPPFLHSTIEFKGQGIEWAFPTVAENARASMRLWNLFRGFIAWAGLWSAMTLILLVGFKRRELFAPFIMSLSLIGVLFIFAPIPDGRYALFALIVGQMALLGKMIEWVQTGSIRRLTN